MIIKQREMIKTFKICCLCIALLWANISRAQNLTKAQNQTIPKNGLYKILDIKFYQKPLFAVADLKSTENYTITTGKPFLIPPNYDLAYFKESISDALPEAQITSIEYQKLENTSDTKTSFWQQPWFMWLCITAGGLMILFFSMRLIKDL